MSTIEGPAPEGMKRLPSDEFSVIFPRRKTVNTNSKHDDCSPVFVTKEFITPYFTMPMLAACEELGVCPTAMKKACRKLGIMKWPYRQTMAAAKQSAKKSKTSAKASSTKAKPEEPAPEVEETVGPSLNFPSLQYCMDSMCGFASNDGPASPNEEVDHRFASASSAPAVQTTSSSECWQLAPIPDAFLEQEFPLEGTLFKQTEEVISSMDGCYKKSEFTMTQFEDAWHSSFDDEPSVPNAWNESVF
ncbi:hypothetical protein GUITHDRAFT_149792 [Guillardia theta CCMP2712]|uniref:RWP-RK domain-containing protein n=2 Tax=Guillardia theta TaxID=55529 RepID=L1K4B9_GUITC|nr:hypothetical protein GUITHDRAFT_149792 [Guillardia theta CCMP2712]EKX55427.1 hypothetical protein GUITHDRAFT_149792 [Guillardia theta CCMP2712]|mmetsp:Transcript_8721/g.29095  ORF Transcript_8721/g.29095 Transcript_8721/m.29095 type:complete len:246 (+) Transcript_8721:211-948(+)|eukprot:XP_005842407.1 hypothetical protein GUITHDRAFT_149792 [Guillardia theta CCMP2712]